MFKSLVFLLLLITINVSSISSSCYKVDKSWNPNEIINVLDSISDPDECQQLCKDESQCVAWTYTTANNFDYQEGCFLFSSIGHPVAYNDSISGPPDCLCSDHFACKADEDDIVDRIFGVIKEEDCQTLCANNSNCQVYTCVCPEQDYDCPGCFSGPRSCQQSIVTTTQEPETQLAIIVTGSTCIEWTCNGQSVEVLKDDGTSLCSLPDLPDERAYHTQSGLVTCGGGRTMTSCYKFSSGVWTESHSLLHHRYDHSAWSSPVGLALIGGFDGSLYRTELLTDDGQSFDFFKLKYETGQACSIQLEETVILTGGWFTKNKASVYSKEGWIEDLPDFLEGRHDHGCGHYVNDDNKMVYLVTGGTGTGFRTISTEILVSGATSWTQVGDLPTVPITGLRGASINNKIIMTGGVAASTTYDYVLSYNTSDGSWTQVGNMIKPRGYHAVSVVPLDQIIEYCK